jgi:hypothetical protein
MSPFFPLIIQFSVNAGHDYSDSYFYNNPAINYPTTNDQKRLARAIASTLEGSDPNTSKYHKYKKRQLNSQNEGHLDDNEQNLSNINESNHPPSLNRFVYDENIPEIIRNSIELAERIDPVRQVFATDEFKQQHFTPHTTHTEMPPQAAMSFAAELHQAGGRGAQIFQKRRAKAEKWVVDETNVKRAPNSISAPPVQVVRKK